MPERGNLRLLPNLAGSDEAPATAKRGDEKNVFNAASMVLGIFRKLW